MEAAPMALVDVRLFRRNVGLIRMEDSRFFRASIPGQCDLYALTRGGGHCEIEVKRFGKLSKEQEVWRDFCVEWEIPWTLVRVERGEQPGVTIDRWLGELRAFIRR
jgi:hypothetical protein